MKKVKVEEKAGAAAVDDEDIPLVRLGAREIMYLSCYSDSMIMCIILGNAQG